MLDTSDRSVHELRRRSSGPSPPAATSTAARCCGRPCVSFGFKYGLPVDADLVVDVRFLPNPFWIPELRELTGEDDEVRDYVLAQEGAAEFLDRYTRSSRSSAPATRARASTT